MDFLTLLLILAITYTTGSIIEKRHFKKIKKREIALIRKPVINFGAKTKETKRKVRKVELVTGEVVISGDYFKNFAAALKNIFGGRLTTFESMLNSLYDSKSVPQCAIIAYGTAITYE